MSAIQITMNNYESEVLWSDRPVLLDFWASWCGPCRMVSPVIDEISNELTDIKVGKINVDEEFELATAFGIMSIPSLILVKDGCITAHEMGARPKKAIMDMLVS